MNWRPWIQKKPSSEEVLKKSVNGRFHFRPLLEVVKQLEEFKYLYLESIKTKDPASVEAAKMYEHYVDVLEWVINANHKDK